jgi:hypothetical protein
MSKSGPNCTNATISVVGAQKIGGGVMKHNLYKITVDFSSSVYTIYRRYRDFERFHEKLSNIYNEEVLAQEHATLPKKRYAGTFLSTFNVIVNERILYLRYFINGVLKLPNISKEECSITFFDVIHKGISGASRQLGKKEIKKEILCQVKPGIGLIEVFSVHFLVLTTGGSLYILKNVYSDTTSPIKLMHISTGDYIVTSIGLILTLDSRSTGIKTLIKFQDISELSSWLRVLADYGLDGSNTNLFVANVAPVTIMDKLQTGPKAKQAKAQEFVQENVHSTGSGYTEDDLNAFGI